MPSLFFTLPLLTLTLALLNSCRPPILRIRLYHT